MARIPQDVTEFLDGGVSILVGSVDEHGRPECTRGMGVEVDGDAGRLTVYVPIVGADRTLANLGLGRRIAITFSRPYDNRTCQVKGRVRATSPASAEDVARQQRWFAAYVEQLAIVGIARAATRRWRITPSVAVEVEVDELFEQTPGPGAGKRIGA